MCCVVSFFFKIINTYFHIAFVSSDCLVGLSVSNCFYLLQAVLTCRRLLWFDLRFLTLGCF